VIGLGGAVIGLGVAVIGLGGAVIGFGGADSKGTSKSHYSTIQCEVRTLDCLKKNFK
jgi:hypothetical protein